MRDQRIDPSTLKQALLGLLLEDHSGLWTLAELNRSLRPSTDPQSNAVDVEDAVEDLYAAGLVHRLDRFVFATRAAHAAQLLAE
jgi:hypothetical protein